LGQAAAAQEVFIVQQQFLKAGTGDVEQAHFGLRGGGGGAAALGDVLPDGSGVALCKTGKNKRQRNDQEEEVNRLAISSAVQWYSSPGKGL
jgi:hypothetical protein